VAVDINVGARLKQRRKEIGLSLRQLAQMSDLSASFLNQVEHGKANVSLHSLQALSEALSVPLLYFLSSDESDHHAVPESVVEEPSVTESQETSEIMTAYTPVVEKDKRPKLFLPLSGVEYELLVPSLGQKMVAILGNLSPGTGNVARRLREPTEEFIFVLSGSLLVGLTGGDYTLSAGDTIYFEGNELLKLSCVSDSESVSWISVITPAVF
jgi:transcriptional regulator with XRE-family HTH domain/quercetin dioxygenase-like cupin family protein